MRICSHCNFSLSSNPHIYGCRVGRKVHRIECIRLSASVRHVVPVCYGSYESLHDTATSYCASCRVRRNCAQGDVAESFDSEFYKAIEDCFVYGDVTFSSGIRGDMYGNLWPLLTDRRMRRLLETSLRFLLQTSGIHFDCVGGPAIAGFALAELIGFAMDADTFVVRKERKAHGLLNAVDGSVRERALLCEDVTSTYESLRWTRDNLLREYPNVEIVGCLILLDREEGDYRAKLGDLPRITLASISEIHV